MKGGSLCVFTFSKAKLSCLKSLHCYSFTKHFNVPSKKLSQCLSTQKYTCIFSIKSGITKPYNIAFINDYPFLGKHQDQREKIKHLFLLVLFVNSCFLLLSTMTLFFSSLSFIYSSILYYFICCASHGFYSVLFYSN